MGDFLNYILVWYNVWFTAPIACVFLFAIFQLVMGGLDFGGGDTDVGADADVEIDADVEVDTDVDTDVNVDGSSGGGGFFPRRIRDFERWQSAFYGSFDGAFCDLGDFRSDC